MPGIAGTMHEYKTGTLRSSSGQKVTNRKQATAIGLSEDRRMGKAVNRMVKGGKARAR